MKKKILVVDDNPDVTYLLKRILSKKGYTTREAHSGEECLELLKNENEKPDLIFMDVMMPYQSGWETARKIKTEPKTKDIPIAMLTVRKEPEDLLMSREYAMADQHLCKPMDFDVILDTVDNLTRPVDLNSNTPLNTCFGAT
ncbi:MAG: response regulator [Candidatus Thorarchaeota archaeon]|jgi:CheY-like chemotaxis protein